MKISKTVASVTVCDGCCCGRIEKGHNEVPINFLKSSWKDYNLENNIKLTISDCLEPCSMHNVTLLKTDSNQIWLGKLSKEEHYNALIDWACEVNDKGEETALPGILAVHRFEPSKIQ